MKQLLCTLAVLLPVLLLSQTQQKYSFTKQLSKGWNLIGYYGYKSAPIEAALKDIWDEVVLVKNQDSFYSMQNQTYLNSLDSLRSGDAYFVLVEEDCMLSLSGCDAAEFKNAPIPHEYTFSKQLSEGWNLIGYYGYRSAPIKLALDDIWDRTQSVKTLEASFVKETPDYLNTLDSLRLGDGYFVYAEKACTISYSGCEPLDFNISDLPANFTITVKGVDFDMIYLEGGRFQRGCDDCPEVDQQYESPEHQVSLSNYHIAKFELTNEQWIAVMGGELPWGASGKTPKIGVSWFEANEFICKLNQITGKTFRLLTDAEWEFAAKGGVKGLANNFTYSGSNNADEVAWHSGNSNNQPHEVGTKAPNELGVYDMSGNSWEWVYDWLVPYTGDALIDPVQLTGTGNKTRRGGQYGEPEAFARVTRRAIRSRDGAAGMGVRIAHSDNLPSGMLSPCEAANPSSSACEGQQYRDCRLITEEGQVWTGEAGKLIVRQNGTAVITGYPDVSGEWYTLNNRSFNIVTATGTKTYAYYVFSEDELTMIGSDGMPYRLYKRSESEASGEIPAVPVIASPTDLAVLISAVEPERMVTDDELATPDKSVRDQRLVPEEGYTWFMDGRCCGGNHKYRFHLKASGEAEFVVMDYDDTYHENVLSTGTWFTVGNIALHIEFDGGYYNYLYTTGTRTMSFSEYLPEGPIWSHISFQHYERGDFRIFSRFADDDNVHRPRGPLGDQPVYSPEEYQVNSNGN